MPFGGLLTGGLALGGAYLNYKNSQNQGGGGGGGLSPTNPSFGVLNNLFGMKMHQHKHGADAGTTSLVKDPKNQGLFGGQFNQSIQDFMFNPPPIFGGEKSLVSGLLDGGGAQNALQGGLAGFDSLLGRGNQFLDQAQGAGFVDPGLLSTGYGVDVNPLFETARNQFSRNVLPEVAERMGLTSGIRSQGFVDTAGREGANLMDSAALAAVDQQNQAAGRRANAQGLNAQLRANALQGGIPMMSTLLGARTALPFSVASDSLNLGTQYRNILDQQASRPLSVFSQLAGLGSPGNQGFLLGGYNPQGSGTANILGSLASSLPKVLGSLGGLGGQLNGTIY